ncbi:MAG TPA: zinc ribbon domain-containing protein [Steroidobacteraceae bacterium]|jgi:putative FmdB family regulatory protein
MPFYEYECDNCKFYTELLQKITDPPLKKCPSCGKNAMKKLVSAPVFRLKGGGWYETDFKSEKEDKRNLAVEKEPESASDAKPAAEAADKSKSADTKTSDAKSTESKPAAAASSGSGSRTRARPAAAAKSKATAKSRSKPAAKRRKRR